MNRFESYSKPRVALLAFLLAAFVAGCGSGGAAQDPILGGGPIVTGVVPPSAGGGEAPGVGNPGPAGFGPALGAAFAFGGFGGSAGMTNAGINTIITGAAGQPVTIGTTAVSTSMTGFHSAGGAGCIYTETPLNIGAVDGAINTAPPPPTGACPTEGTAATFAIAQAAFLAAQAAFIDLSPANRPGGIDPGAGQLSGLTLAPGIYQAAGGSFGITGILPTSDLTLDAGGNADAVWVFQMASTLTVGSPGFPRSVILAGGAQPKNVFWQVGSAATITPGGGTMVGTIIANSGVTIGTNAASPTTTLNGRALSLVASVVLNNTVVNVPPP